MLGLHTADGRGVVTGQARHVVSCVPGSSSCSAFHPGLVQVQLVKIFVELGFVQVCVLKLRTASAPLCTKDGCWYVNLKLTSGQYPSDTRSVRDRFRSDVN